MKKYITLLTLSLSLITPRQSLQGFVNTKEIVKETFEAIRDESHMIGESLGGIMKGAGTVLKEGGEADVFAQDAGQVIGRSTNEIFSGFGDGLEKAFKNGGKFDAGIKNMVTIITKNGNQIGREVFKYSIRAALLGIGVKITHNYIDMYFKALQRPKLIIDSSQKSFLEKIAFKTQIQHDPVILHPDLETRLNTIVKATQNINKNIAKGKTNVKYRNLMLYGPPGTGKTMFAKQLAQKSGLEYAFMSGSSFAKFNQGQGIEELDKLFAWAKKSKGLMIFIDEAETFLAKRENMDPNSHAYKLLNNFLNYTGERSSQFMLVFATNHKNSLDSAMYRRIDDLVEMPLPGHTERIKLLTSYKNKILIDKKQNEKAFIESVEQTLDDAKIASIANLTKGLSGGELEGIINIIKTNTDILDPALVTTQLIDTVVKEAVQKHQDFTNGKELGTVTD